MTRGIIGKTIEYLQRGRVKIAKYLRDLESVDINTLEEMTCNP